MTNVTRQRQAQVFLEAARLIEQYGLARGWYSEREAVCAVGAIRVAIFDTPDPALDASADCDFYYDALVDLAAFVAYREGGLYSAPTGFIANWSDRSEPEHVVATLRAAASVVPEVP
jgi:hypothetical protein